LRQKSGFLSQAHPFPPALSFALHSPRRSIFQSTPIPSDPMLFSFFSLSRCSTAVWWNWTQRMDHYDPILDQSFTQRVVHDYSYSGDIHNFTHTILYLPGLTPLNDTNPFPSSVRKIAQNVKAAMIAVEHRFLGGSNPFSTLTSDALYFCTPDQALCDYAQVVASLPNVSRLLVVGSSYGGNLATWMKIKFPQFVDAAWASSAAVQVVGTFQEFDANLLEALDSVSTKCRDATSVVMREIDAAFVAGDNESRAMIRDFFGFPVSVSDVSLLYEIAESFVLMVDSETTGEGLLDDFCAVHTSPNIKIVGEAFQKTLATFGFTHETFDPRSAVENATDPILMRERVKWYTTCIVIGQLHVYNPDAPFRSRFVNFSYYNETCSVLFGFPVVVGEKYNMLYGGLNMRGSSTLFTYSQQDLMWQLMSIVSDVTSDVYAESFDGWSMPDDVRERAITRMSEWITDTQDTCNGKGERILNQCKCKKGWEGESCNEVFVVYEVFWRVSALGTGVLTLAITIVGACTWKIFLGDLEGRGLTMPGDRRGF
jgi:hypothetical protein